MTFELPYFKFLIFAMSSFGKFLVEHVPDPDHSVGNPNLGFAGHKYHAYYIPASVHIPDFRVAIDIPRLWKDLAPGMKKGKEKGSHEDVTCMDNWRLTYISDNQGTKKLTSQPR